MYHHLLLPSRSIVLSIACCLVIWNQQQSSLLTTAYALVNTGTTASVIGRRQRQRQQQRQQQQQRQRQKSPFTKTTATTTKTNQREQRQRHQNIIRTSPDQRWEEIHGNYVLKPLESLNEDGSTSKQQPITRIRGIIHFLGGAFVGVAPHVSYRYMLERLCLEEGYLIVATPYQMSFNHLDMCTIVQERFHNIIPIIKQQYGQTILDDVPIINVGHSCGSLLHLLMSTSSLNNNNNNNKQHKQQQQQYVASANVFMSFNNKPAAESIPYFDELVTPISQYFTQTYYSDKPNQLNFIRLAHEARAVSDVGLVLQGLEKLETNAGRDFDFILYEMKRAAHLMYPINQILPLKAPQALPPSVFSEAAKFGLSGLLRPAKRTLQTMTLINQIVDGVDSQVPLLLKQISDGSYTDFSPPPKSVKEFVQRSYKSPKTLIVQYEEDQLDESQEILQLLMKHHPNQSIQHTKLKGGHSAPLIAPPLHVATSAEKRFGQNKAKEKLGYAFADATVEELTNWLNQELKV